jgi:opacity protein-like surface antigen
MKILTLVSALFFFCQYAEAKDNQAKQSQPKQQSGAIYGGINSNYTYGNNHVTTFAKKGFQNPAATYTYYLQGTGTDRLAHSGFGFGSFIGWVHQINKILVMMDISYDSNRLKERTTIKPISAFDPEGPYDVNIVDPRVDHDYVALNRNNTWAGSLRLGYAMEPSFVVFIKGSLLRSSFSIEYGSIGVFKNTQKKLMGFEPGVGVDVNLPKGVFMRAEYGYQLFKKFASENILPVKHEPDEKVICSLSPRYHVIRLGLGYKFKTF